MASTRVRTCSLRCSSEVFSDARVSWRERRAPILFLELVQGGQQVIDSFLEALELKIDAEERVASVMVKL